MVSDHGVSSKDAGVQGEALRFLKELEVVFKNQEALSSECQLQDFEPFALEIGDPVQGG